MFRLICGRTPQAGSQEGAAAHPVLQVGTAVPQDGAPQGLTAHDGVPHDGLLQGRAPHGSMGVPQPPTRAGVAVRTSVEVVAVNRATEAAQAGHGPEGSYPTGYVNGAAVAAGVGVAPLTTGCQYVPASGATATSVVETASGCATAASSDGAPTRKRRARPATSAPTNTAISVVSSTCTSRSQSFPLTLFPAPRGYTSNRGKSIPI